MQSTEFNQTKEKLSFRSIQLVVTVGRFPQNCICPFRPKMNFQAECFKLLTIHSVPSERARNPEKGKRAWKLFEL
uniref:Uncharacterized protein n=1 Tax=Romanomermis culicivorax TaxID=13658 RepID=A0A915KC60_ROMCU